MGKKFKNKDLAAKLGVSGTLVSLVLNNKADLHGIRKETQEKVLLAARQMGFFSKQPDEPKVYEVEEAPGIVGMIVPHINDPFVESVTPYLQKAFASIGVAFSVITKDSDDQRFERMIPSFRKFYSGIILYEDAADESTIRHLRSYDYPFVLLETCVSTGKTNSVCTDSAFGAELVHKHILKTGHKNIIVVIEKQYRKNNTCLEELLSELGKSDEINKPVILELEEQMPDGTPNLANLEQFLTPPFRADLIISMQAEYIFPLIQWLRTKKIRIPADIGLISMEDGKGFELIDPPVTALQTPVTSLAIKTANMVWSEIKNSGKGKFKRQATIHPVLIVRGSCGSR